MAPYSDRPFNHKKKVNVVEDNIWFKKRGGTNTASFLEQEITTKIKEFKINQ